MRLKSEALTVLCKVINLMLATKSGESNAITNTSVIQRCSYEVFASRGVLVSQLQNPLGHFWGGIPNLYSVVVPDYHGRRVTREF